MKQATSIQFVLHWIAEKNGEPVRTIAGFSVEVDGSTVWPTEAEPDVFLEIFVDDLLTHVTKFWKPLLLRQTYPLADRVPERPSLLRTAARERWNRLPDDVVEKEEPAIEAFEECHDLSRAFSGQFELTPLYLVRSNEWMLVDNGRTCRSVVFDTARRALDELGEKIAGRLRETDPYKWQGLLTSWEKRNEGDPTRLLAWATGLRPEVAAALVKGQALTAPRTVPEAANDDDELRIAARMSSALPEPQILQVLNLVRNLPSRRARPLEELQAATLKHFEAEGLSDLSPHSQGEDVARFVRAWLQVAQVQKVDIFALLDRLMVQLETPRVEPPTLDGLAVAGRKHGPAVVINAASNRVKGNPRNSTAARVTAAHEFCHLLLDARHTLSAVDVLNNRMPPAIERRAKSFAGEFLLPSRVAADKWEAEGHPTAVAPLAIFVAQLAAAYGVPKAVAAWKLEHGAHWYEIDLSWQLDQIAPHR